MGEGGRIGGRPRRRAGRYALAFAEPARGRALPGGGQLPRREVAPFTACTPSVHGWTLSSGVREACAQAGFARGQLPRRETAPLTAYAPSFHVWTLGICVRGACAHAGLARGSFPGARSPCSRRMRRRFMAGRCAVVFAEPARRRALHGAGLPGSMSPRSQRVRRWFMAGRCTCAFAGPARRLALTGCGQLPQRDVAPFTAYAPPSVPPVRHADASAKRIWAYSPLRAPCRSAIPAQSERRQSGGQLPPMPRAAPLPTRAPARSPCRRRPRPAARRRTVSRPPHGARRLCRCRCIWPRRLCRSGGAWTAR